VGHTQHFHNLDKSNRHEPKLETPYCEIRPPFGGRGRLKFPYLSNQQGAERNLPLPGSWIFHNRITLVMAKLVRLIIVENATQKNVTGEKNWVTVRKKSTYVIVEATTAPKNNDEEWKQIKWSGDTGEPVKGKLNRRKLSIAASKKYHVEATVGGVKDYVDIWILWATVEFLTKHLRPNNAAPFEPNSRDNTDKLGAVTYKSLTSSVIDESAGLFVDNMGASGKVAPVATLSPRGVGQVIQSGLSFRPRTREAVTRGHMRVR
jgi:hypothetical protein